MPNVLIHGDTVRYPTMRHEIPLMVPDPFLYVEAGGQRHVVVSSLERSRLVALDSGLSVHAFEEFGYDDSSSGIERQKAVLEVHPRVRRLSSTRHGVRPSSPTVCGRRG